MVQTFRGRIERNAGPVVAVAAFASSLTVLLYVSRAAMNRRRRGRSRLHDEEEIAVVKLEEEARGESKASVVDEVPPWVANAEPVVGGVEERGGGGGAIGWTPILLPPQ